MNKINFAVIKRKTLSLFRPIISHHAIIFIVLSLFFLMYVVYNTQRILTTPEDTEYRKQAEQKGITTQFDEATIKKVQQLQDRKNALKPTLPTNGRINPFTE